MSERWITVANFATPEEAHIACTALCDAGVPARVDDDVIVGLAWHLGTALGGVKVKVPEQHVAAAREFLNRAEEFEQQPAGGESPNTPQRTGRPNACPACGERAQAGFDLCWNCGALLTVDPALDEPSPLEFAVGTEAAAVAVDLDVGDAVEAESALDDDAAPRSPSAAVLTDRAFKAAVIGCIVCPGLLQAYSIWNLLKAAAVEDLDDHASALKWYGALLINLVSLAYFAMLMGFVAT
ncbi:MAG: DUF2007 domain-containing protein [Pirellulales bacterium]|nr:DUF2007 domain-containing protein [Pirellulales bacterium]